MTKEQVLSKLVLQKSNFRKFALAHNYNPRTVNQTATRYLGGTDLPRGILTYKILRDLSKTIGEPVIDGLAELTN